MSYQAMCLHISPDGTGVHELSQGQRAKASQVDIQGGVCRGIVIDWLNYWKSWNGTFWAEDDKVPESKGLMSDTKMMQSAKVNQVFYSKLNVGRDTMDEGTKGQLSTSGLAHKAGDSLKSPGTGFDKDRWTIATHVLSSDSRYFILSIGGEKGKKKTAIGHAIGIYRPWVMFGKGTTVYAFDPNIGEFKLEGEKGIAKFLHGLNTIEYASVNFDVNYYLWAFN